MRTVNTDKGEIQYDDDMRIGTLRGLFTSAKEGDLDTLVDSLSQIVTEWPYEGDPQDDDEWDQLRLSEFQTITAAIMTDLGGLGEA